MKSNASKIELTAYDDLFETDESREELKLSKICDIPLCEIDDFPEHPFKVREDDEDMTQLTESIKQRGVITPVTVRLKEDGRYELISGHRRRRACELAGVKTIRAEVKELTRDEAIILMVDSNLQRSTILPSERAFSYKMRLEAMKRQAGRPIQDNYSPMANNYQKTSSAELAETVGTSKDQIFRYIRITYLIAEIIDMVDEKKIAFRPAVEISYLPQNEQYILLEAMECQDATPSLSQAIKIKGYSRDGQLTNALVDSIMQEEKPNQKAKPEFSERISKLIPKNVPKGKETDFVVKAIEHYNKFIKRSNRER
ncbi:MAG: ParB/RepB/Spo0J family partition protein [Clostridia bacterium]|nr:ParB/RepB/Spo0J family partition protein [Clostridia bacterium]